MQYTVDMWTNFLFTVICIQLRHCELASDGEQICSGDHCNLDFMISMADKNTLRNI